MPKKSPRQLFRKLFLIYTAVVVGIVAGLMAYFLSATMRRARETNLDYTGMACDKAQSYVKSSSNTADYILSNLYQSQQELQDLLQYLTTDIESYLKYRLNLYSALPSNDYHGIDNFTEETMDAHDTIKRIQFISYENGELTTYLPQGKSYRGENKDELLGRIEKGDLGAEGEISFRKEIRDPQTMNVVGCMLVTFQTDELAKAHEIFPEARMAVYTQAGTFVYRSDLSIEEKSIRETSDEKELEKLLASHIVYQSVGDYSVLSYLPKQEAVKISPLLFFTIIGVGLGMIALGEGLIHHYLVHLTLRLNRILEGMEQVRQGNLQVRLETEEKKDELDVIAENFNVMCENLDLYIEKSYRAEIEQKNAEMAALQSQINPHFLYNTLESIRMKAICNGDREVGKMLYGLAVLFRSQIKEKDVITMAQELHYCKKYLELFEFRYQNKFRTQVECPEEYINVPVIKFIVQPLIENYFVHGIRMEDSDNYLHIYVKREGERMQIFVDDNGRGMDIRAIEQKNRELKENRQAESGSIGLSNVNLRVKAAYGNNFGVTIREGGEGGLCIVIEFPWSESDEKSNAGGR